MGVDDVEDQGHGVNIILRRLGNPSAIGWLALGKIYLLGDGRCSHDRLGDRGCKNLGDVVPDFVLIPHVLLFLINILVTDFVPHHDVYITALTRVTGRLAKRVYL